MAESQIIRKIVPKNIMGDIKKLVPAEGAKPIALYRVFGNARDVRKGESAFGPFTALVGRFEAVRVLKTEELGDATGEIFTAPECFVPEPINTMMAQVLEETRAVLDTKGDPVMETVYDTVTSTDPKGQKSTSKVPRQQEKRERITDSVDFAFEVCLKHAATATGYEYSVNTLVKPDTADPLAALRAKALAGSSFAQIEAPKPDAEKSAPPAARKR